MVWDAAPILIWAAFCTGDTSPTHATRSCLRYPFSIEARALKLRSRKAEGQMPWKTIIVVIGVAVLAVVAYDIATYKHIFPNQVASPK